MKIKVIKNGYYVNDNLSCYGMVDQGTFESSFVHSLVVGDVWVKKVEDDGFEYFECIEGKWENEVLNHKEKVTTKKNYLVHKERNILPT